jgi:hypothetical protein
VKGQVSVDRLRVVMNSSLKGEVKMSSRYHPSRSIIASIMRATVDIVTVASMVPLAFAGYITYKIALYLTLISLQSIVVHHSSAIQDSVRQLYAEIKAVGPQALKSRLRRMLPWNLWPALRWSSMAARAQTLLTILTQRFLVAMGDNPSTPLHIVSA